VDSVAVAIAVATAIADGVVTADVVARRQPNQLVLPYNRRTFPPVAVDAIAVPVPVALSREVIRYVENNNNNSNN